MSFHFILIFAFTVFIASIIPGPSMMLALTHGMQHGARKTIASAMGNLTVTLIQAAVSIAGLGTILIASETVFSMIKWMGAAYLIYLGIGFIFSSKISFTPARLSQPAPPPPRRKMFRQAALVTAANPKAIIFFTAIFPQFIDVRTGFLTQSCILLGIGGMIAFACFMLYAAAGQKLFSLFSSAGAAKQIRRVIGGTFIGVGIGLAVED